jgi:hypothetical protein
MSKSNPERSEGRPFRDSCETSKLHESRSHSVRGDD